MTDESERPLCPKCGGRAREHELVCEQCGAPLGADGPAESAAGFGAIARPRILATRAARMMHFTIDFVVLFGLNTLIWGAAMKREMPVGDPADNSMFAIWSALLASYYILCEWTFGRTLGKWIVGSRVVNMSGGRPSLLQILARTFVRILPFEPLSVLVSPAAVGWRDRLSATRTIRTR